MVFSHSTNGFLDLHFNQSSEESITKTLGVLWNSSSDTFCFKVSPSINLIFRKRDVLSQIARIFDSLGLFGPVISKAKFFMQQLWLLKLEWHEKLPVPVAADDASEKGFGAVTYVSVIKNNGDRHSQLLCSKFKVAPLKTLTIPRVSKIQELTVNFSWHHISSENNPADLVSRGLSVSDLISSPLWWKGPDPSILSNDELLENINDCEVKKEFKIPPSKNLLLSSEFDLFKAPEETLVSYFNDEHIDWNFILPRSPNFGGLWESGVKSFKTHLKSVAGNSNLTLEEFITLLADIEAVLNSRPLSPLSSDFDDFETLSPGHFLIRRPVTVIVEPQLINVKENRLTEWQRVNSIYQQIWKVWKRSYLNNLQERERRKQMEIQ
ncbi:reverse transcriptase domain-containing protein [Trichonephila clavipes]|nr:reverse transcriptase domain-containing protein [Trichonephila clavipes]